MKQSDESIPCTLKCSVISEIVISIIVYKFIQAIGRLGGQSLLQNAQSARSLVMDRSLKDMLIVLGNCEKDIHKLHIAQENYISIINDFQTKIDQQSIIMEQHENRMQHLNHSLQKGESEAIRITAELNDQKVAIDTSLEDIKASKKGIQKTEDTLKCIQESAVEKQNKLNILTQQLVRLQCIYDKKFETIDEHLVKHDEHIAKYDEHLTKQDEHMTTCEKNIDDMKEQLYNTRFQSGKIGLVFFWI